MKGIKDKIEMKRMKNYKAHNQPVKQDRKFIIVKHVFIYSRVYLLVIVG